MEDDLHLVPFVFFQTLQFGLIERKRTHKFRWSVMMKGQILCMHMHMIWVLPFDIKKNRINIKHFFIWVVEKRNPGSRIYSVKQLSHCSYIPHKHEKNHRKPLKLISTALPIDFHGRTHQFSDPIYQHLNKPLAGSHQQLVTSFCLTQPGANR